MTAKDLMDAGQLGPAIARLSEDLRTRPADRGRARSCSNCSVSRTTSSGPSASSTSWATRMATRWGSNSTGRCWRPSESRARLFAEGLRPRFVLESPPAVELHLEALDLLRLGRPAQAREALDRAGTPQAALRGTAGDVAFDEFRDFDDILAPVLEVVAPAGYFWVPWEHIQHLSVSPPRNLRDLLWTPVDLATFDGQLGQVYVPNLYPGTATHPDDLVRLGRKTVWQDAGEGIVRVRAPRSSWRATNPSPFRSWASFSSRRFRKHR